MKWKKRLKKEPLTFDQVTTRGGDRGESSLYDGRRLRKDDLVFETLGDLDELNARLGLHYVWDRELFRTIQSHLFTISALAATSSRSEQFKSLTTLGEKEIHWLELTQKTLMEKITIEPRFYYSDEICAPLEISRTLCRRCERRVVTCIRERGKSELIASQKYLNRLSDFLWVYARSIS